MTTSSSSVLLYDPVLMMSAASHDEEPGAAATTTTTMTRMNGVLAGSPYSSSSPREDDHEDDIDEGEQQPIPPREGPEGAAPRPPGFLKEPPPAAAAAAPAERAAGAAADGEGRPEPRGEKPPPSQPPVARTKNDITRKHRHHHGTKKRKKHEDDGTTNNNNKRRRMLYRDSVLVEIPIDRTVDLSSIVATCRDRTLTRIYDKYPQLNPKKGGGQRNGAHSQGHGMILGTPPTAAASDDDDDDDEAVEEGASEEKKRRKQKSGPAPIAAAGENSKEAAKKKDASSSSSPAAGSSSVTNKMHKPVGPLPHVPQKEDYGSMIEYLEAKYVQGVMLPDRDALDEEGASDEGAGSVYSNDSFFDDTDLQRGVASQVLAHSTTTKVELLASPSNNNRPDDHDFFVNVGNLEVEESEYTKEHYDPLRDVDPKKAAKKSASTTGKKRKKPDSQDATVGTSSKAGGGAIASSSSVATKKKKAKPTPAADETDSKKPSSKGVAKENKKSSAAAANGALLPLTKANAVQSSGKGSDAKGSTSADGVGSAPLKAAADEKKECVDDLYQRLVLLIPNETFPTRKGKVKVSITCPVDKGAGDFIMFSNPHIPGQRLKVQIPKTAQPGQPFKVQVPGEGAPDPATDYNKLSRDFHLLLDEYARAFDEWCDALGAYRKSVDENDCSAHFEKRTKFDKLTGEFPTKLKTPVDKAYLQKILRRARQNRSKRENNAKLKDEGKSGGGGGDASASVTASPTGSTKSESKGGGGAAASHSPSSSIHAKAQDMIRRHSLSSSMATTSKEQAAAAAKLGKPASDSKSPTEAKVPMGVPKLFRDFMRKKFDEADFASSS